MPLAPARPHPKTSQSRSRHALSSQRERDPESALMHYRARSYDPRIGGFIQRDPIVHLGVSRPFEYASGNPVSRTDPLGTTDLDAQDVENIRRMVDELQKWKKKIDFTGDLSVRIEWDHGKGLHTHYFEKGREVLVTDSRLNIIKHGMAGTAKETFKRFYRAAIESGKSAAARDAVKGALELITRYPRLRDGLNAYRALLLKFRPRIGKVGGKIGRIGGKLLLVAGIPLEGYFIYEDVKEEGVGGGMGKYLWENSGPGQLFALFEQGSSGIELVRGYFDWDEYNNTRAQYELTYAILNVMALARNEDEAAAVFDLNLGR